MQKQAVINLLFDKTVETIRTVSIARATVPILLLLSVWGVLLSQPVEHEEEEWRFGLALQQLRPMGSLPDFLIPQLPSIAAQQAVNGVPLTLTKPQRNLVQYITNAYRVEATDVAEYVSIAYAKAREFKVDPLLVLAIMSIESSFDPMAQSPVGAQGLMQVLTRVHTEKFHQFGGPKLAFDIRANIHVGTQIIRDYIAREGSIELGLKSYVGAALMSDDGGYGWKVMGQMARLKAIAAGQPIPVIAQRKPSSDISSDTSAGSEAIASNRSAESTHALQVETSTPALNQSLTVPATGTIAVGYTPNSSLAPAPNREALHAEPHPKQPVTGREPSHSTPESGSSSE